MKVEMRYRPSFILSMGTPVFLPENVWTSSKSASSNCMILRYSLSLCWFKLFLLVPFELLVCSVLTVWP